MEKIFTPNKFFLFFCIFFVLEFLGLQLVSYLHITNQAKLDGERIFNWNWPSKNKRSVAEICETKILSRNSNDAVVKVSGKEYLDRLGCMPAKNYYLQNMKEKANTKANKCTAVLNYYRMNNKWFLGKVEFE